MGRAAAAGGGAVRHQPGVAAVSGVGHGVPADPVTARRIAPSAPASRIRRPTTPEQGAKTGTGGRFMLTDRFCGDVMLVSYRGRIPAEGPPACPGADRHPGWKVPLGCRFRPSMGHWHSYGPAPPSAVSRCSVLVSAVLSVAADAAGPHECAAPTCSRALGFVVPAACPPRPAPRAPSCPAPGSRTPSSPCARAAPRDTSAVPP